MMRATSFGAGLALSIVAGAALYVAADDDRDRICRHGYAQSLRLRGEAYERLRDAAFARASIPVSMQCHEFDPRPDCYILDHIVPLELDGANILDNLQVQRRGEAALKDDDENETRRDFCDGKIKTLPEAQAHFHRSTR